MNHWMAEELTWLAHAERQRELDAYRLQNDFSALQVNLTYSSRLALKLSDWLIATGEGLRRRHGKTTPVVVPWIDVRKYVR